MVNWHDPHLLLNDFMAFTKLNHAIVGIYIWEVVITAGFELDVLRGKRPYRWTIWLYLGTRYTGLLSFILFLIEMDSSRVSCQSLTVATRALGYACWAFASLLIILRVIAIWNKNIIISLIAVGVWLGVLAMHMRNLTVLVGKYNPIVNACVTLRTRKGLVNAIGILVVDIVLLLMMLIGLLRHTDKNSSSIWKLLYEQCIIWLGLALIAEIPVVVFLTLNLNNVWNGMFLGVAVAILSIGSARMYRSLSDWGSFSQYVTSDMSKFTTMTSGLNAPCGGPGPIAYNPSEFPSVAQSGGTRTTHESPALPPADHIHIEFIPDGSIPSLVHESMKDKGHTADSAVSEAV